MDTTIHTREDVDLGDGPVRTVVVPDSQSTVDKQTGTLHIHNVTGTIASFNEPVWGVSIRGVVRTVNGVSTVSLA